MKNLIGIAVILLLPASWLPAQGGVVRTYTLGGVDLFLAAVGPELRWGGPGQRVVTSLPLTSVGCDGMAQLPSGQIVVAGRAGSVGRLVRMTLSPGQAHASVVQQMDVGALDPESVVYHPLHGLLLLDNTNGLLFSVSLQQGVLGALDLLADFSATPEFRPWRLHVGVDSAIETVDAVYGTPLVEDDVHTGLRYLFSPPTSGTGQWSWTLDSYVSGGFVGNGWGVVSAWVQGVDDPLIVTNHGGGGFQVVRMLDGSAVYAGSVPSNGVAVVDLPGGTLAAGMSYRLEGGGAASSKVFWPSYRRGAVLLVDDLSLPKVGLDDDNFMIGRDLRIRGALHWSGPAENSGVAINCWLWCSVGEPGPDVISDLPDGRSFLTNPLAMWAEPDPAVVPKRVGLALSHTLTIANDEDLADTPLLFQWIAVSANGNLVLSDVFGSRVRKDASTAALQQGASTGSAQPTPTVLARRRQWIRGNSDPQCVGTINSLKHHLATSPNAPWQP